ncbi:MAG: phosphoglucosamine mutase [Acidimicrobiia bacterium]|nr:phosphoglucosamine mutase [Acidimicrobiia bacterium]
MESATDLRHLLENGHRLFGTDGVRGEAGTELTAELALAIGRAAGSVLSAGHVVIGRDTRRSGPMLSAAIQAGFHSVGANTIDIGIATSGAISYLTGALDAGMGVVVSASHNPAPDNGIKLLGPGGRKLKDAAEDEVEQLVRLGVGTRARGGAVGTDHPGVDANTRYLDWLTGLAENRFEGLSVMVDAANGAASFVGPELFRRLGADVAAIGNKPDGLNINDGVGATNPETLAAAAGGRIGLAFDGDADRLIAVDEDGEIVDGDVIMAIVARHLDGVGRLRNRTVVSTVMSNVGLERSLGEVGIELVRTKVGDRYVVEAMDEHDAVLGGEQSGHILFRDDAATGDGLLTAVRLLDVMMSSGSELRELRATTIRQYPQVLQNVRVARGIKLDDASAVWSEVKAIEAELGDEGRVFLRPSGTEPLIRVMVESAVLEDAQRHADRLCLVVESELAR